MRLQGQVHVNDVDLTRGGKGLLVASNIGIQMWNVAGFGDSSPKEPKSNHILKKVQYKRINTKLAKKTKVISELKKPKKPYKPYKTKKIAKKIANAESGKKSPRSGEKESDGKSQIQKMQTSGNPKLNFSTKYNFDFKAKKETQKSEIKPNEVQQKLERKLFSKQPVLTQPKRQDDQAVQYSFPMQSNKENQKSTRHYLKAEHRLNGFEKNVGEINGKLH